MPTSNLASEPRDPMTRLQYCWYTAVVDQLLLARDTFQLSQPSQLISNDTGFWTCQNQIPPLSLTFNPFVAGFGTFFDQYAAIALKVQFPIEDLSQEIGVDNYQVWKEYLGRQNPAPGVSDLPALFTSWASVYAPSVATAGTAALSRMALLDAARKALDVYCRLKPHSPEFRGGYVDLLRTVEQAPGATISFDSRSAGRYMADTEDKANTWARSMNAGCCGLWAESDKDSPVSRMFGSSDVNVEVLFGSLAVWMSTPGDWYNSSLLHLLYSDPRKPPWPADPSPGWQEIFGAGGSMTQLIGSLLMVDGIDATIRSDAIYKEDDQRAIVESAAAGLWPFYVSSAAAHNDPRFDADGGMTIRTVTKPGNPLVLGANVLGIARYLGHGPP